MDGKVVATQKMEHTMPLTLPWDETFDIGSDTGTPVDDADYQVPFAFTGKIDKLTIAVAPPVLTDDGQEEADGGRKGGAGRQLIPPECGNDPLKRRRNGAAAPLS